MSSARSSKADPELLPSAALKLGRREWSEARELYEQALATEETAEGLEGLAVASWWLDDVDEAIKARERAYVLGASVTRRWKPPASRASWPGTTAPCGARTLSPTAGCSVPAGWSPSSRPSAEHAWLPLIEASFHLDTDAEAVLRLSTEAAEQLGHGGLDIEMTARTLQGLALVSLGRVEEGTRLLDEGTAAATSGELYDPIAIGSCCCNMIIACERARDFDRAGQWCAQLAAFWERTGQRPLLALCRAHHGTVLTHAGRVGSRPRRSWLGRGRARDASSAARRVCPRPIRGAAPSPGEAAVRPRAAHRGGRPRAGALVQAGLALDDDDPSAALAHAESTGAASAAIARSRAPPRWSSWSPRTRARRAGRWPAPRIRTCGARRRRSGPTPSGRPSGRPPAGSRWRTAPRGGPARARGCDRPLRASGVAVRGGAGAAGAGAGARGHERPDAALEQALAASRSSRSSAPSGRSGRRQAGRPARRAEHAAKRAGLTTREAEVSRSWPTGSPTVRSPSDSSSASTRCIVTSRTSTRSSAFRPERRPLRWAPSAASSADRATSRPPARGGRAISAVEKDGPIGR